MKPKFYTGAKLKWNLGNRSNLNLGFEKKMNPKPELSTELGSNKKFLTCPEASNCAGKYEYINKSSLF